MAGEEEIKPARMISWSDLAIEIFFTWLGTKVLDFIWKKAKANVKLEGKTHFTFYFIRTVGEGMNLYASLVLRTVIRGYQRAESSLGKDTTQYKELKYGIRGALGVHLSVHQYSARARLPPKRACFLCSLISKNKKILQYFEPEPRYYPPYSRKQSRFQM
jgi:hypothetical protein